MSIARLNKDVKVRIKKVLAKRLPPGVKVEDIKDDTPLIELGVGVDSLATLELIVALEQEFQVRLNEEEINIEVLENIESITNYITKRVVSF